jgi:hypothetical protein
MRVYLYVGTIALITIPASAEDAAVNSNSPSTNQAEAAVESGKVVVSNRPVEVLADPRPPPRYYTVFLLDGGFA